MSVIPRTIDYEWKHTIIPRDFFERIDLASFSAASLSSALRYILSTPFMRPGAVRVDGILSGRGLCLRRVSAVVCTTSHFGALEGRVL
jgi:hypothetical protein